MINVLSILVGVLLSVAFMTLVERKILSISQIRKGPELVGPSGLLQPFSDGLKLLSKAEVFWGNNSSILLAPFFFFLLSLIFWVSLMNTALMIEVKILFLLCISSFGGLCTFLAGWNGGSNYSFMGGLRASAQMISYEVIFSFLFMVFSLSVGAFNLGVFSFSISSPRSIFFLFPMVSLWLISTLAETNRAPFDLTEGESELVSGFNTEYSAVSFTLLFLGEYTMILGFSFLSSWFFFHSWNLGLLFCLIILWIRSCFPRKRYDHLMTLMWVYLFPASVFILVFYLVIYSV